jgi:hypothetical protein
MGQHDMHRIIYRLKTGTFGATATHDANCCCVDSASCGKEWWRDIWQDVLPARLFSLSKPGCINFLFLHGTCEGTTLKIIKEYATAANDAIQQDATTRAKELRLEADKHHWHWNTLSNEATITVVRTSAQI